MLSPVEDFAKKQGAPQVLGDGIFKCRHKTERPTFKASCDVPAYFGSLLDRDWPEVVKLKLGDHFINLRSRELLKVDGHCAMDFRYTVVKRGVGERDAQDIKKGDEFYVLGQAGREYDEGIFERPQVDVGRYGKSLSEVGTQILADYGLKMNFARMPPDPNDPVAVCRHRDEQDSKGVVTKEKLLEAERLMWPLHKGLLPDGCDHKQLDTAFVKTSSPFQAKCKACKEWVVGRGYCRGCGTKTLEEVEVESSPAMDADQVSYVKVCGKAAYRDRCTVCRTVQGRTTVKEEADRG